MLPTPDGILSGYYSYSCNCGWIDWGHANGDHAKAVIEKVARLDSQALPDSFRIASRTTLTPFSAWAFQRFGIKGAVTGWIQVRPDLSDDAILGISLGIFKELQIQGEELQGNIKLGPIQPPGVSHTLFSEEDLPSNLIGFYRSARERGGLDESMTLGMVILLCNVLSPEDSLKMYDEAYLKELPAGDMGVGGFIRWRQWEGRLADSCTIRGKCGPPDGRRWPGFFKSIREIRAQEEGLWWVEDWATCVGPLCQVPVLP
jgi:hypothetical protein